MILSSPKETFEDHVKGALRMWDTIKDRMLSSLQRLFKADSTRLEELVRVSIAFHDVGKLTKRWQNEIRKPKPRPPPHSAIGAAYLWKTLSVAEHLTMDSDPRFASAFAVNIHHIDRGIIGENTERPHIQLILYRLVNQNGSIRWHADAQDAILGVNSLLKHKHIPLADLELEDFELMAEDLRRWSRGTGILERHRRRVVTCSLHHILKICDLRAARNRRDLKDSMVSPLVMRFVEGGLLP